MPTVLPPEWDAMSAKEQTIWYLASLIAKVEGMTAEHVAARGDPPMASSLVDPAPTATTSTPEAALVVPSTELATTTLDSSTPIGQTLSGGDGNFVSIITTPAPPAVVKEIHDAASDFCPELAADRTIDATVTAAATDVSSSTTKAQEVLMVIHDAPPACVAMAHITCSAECSHQVATTDIVNEVRDATAAIFLEPAFDLNDTTPILPVADASLMSLVTRPAESMPSVALLNLSLPPAVVHQSDALAHVRCSTDYIVHGDDPVQPTAHTEQQPWPPPVRVRTRHIGHLFRPRPWPSFKSHSDASYQEEPCSGIRHQPQEVLWFSSGLVLRLFRDVVFPQVSGCEMISMEEYFSCLSGAQLPSWRPPDRATSDAKQSNPAGHSQAVVHESSCLQTSHTHVGYLTCLGRATIHMEPVNYKGLQFYPYCRVQSQEVAEWRAHLYASTEFYLEKFACCCPIVPRFIPVVSQPIMQIIGGLYLGVVEGRSIIFPVQPSHEFCAQDAHLLFRISQQNVHLKLSRLSCSCNCRIKIQGTIQFMPVSVHWKFSCQGEFKRSGCTSICLHIGNAWAWWFSLLGKCIRILTGQLLCLWFLTQDRDDSCVSKQLFCEGEQWLLEICTCSITIAPEQHHSCLATMAAHVFQRMHVSQQFGPHELVCCVIFFVQSSYELCAKDVQLKLRFSQKNVQPKLQYFACDCRAVLVWSELPKTEIPDKFCSSVTNLCWPATTSAPDLLSVEYMEDLFLVIHEQSRKSDTTRDLVHKTQEHWNLSEHHILKHATVCSIPMGDKLPSKIQPMSLSVQRNILSQGEFNGSVRFAQGCTSDQHGDLWVLLAYLTVRYIHALQNWHCAKSLPITTQILNEPRWPVASDFIRRVSSCFSLVNCALYVRDQSQVTFSTSNGARIISLVQQLQNSIGVESVFVQLVHISQQTCCSMFNLIYHQLDNPIPQLVEQELSFSEPDAGVCRHEHIQVASEGTQGWYSLCCACSRAFPNSSAVVWVKEMHKSWERGSTTMPTSHLQLSKVIVVMVINKEARAMGGMASCTLSCQEHVQEGGSVIVVTAGFAQGSVDSFNNYCFLGISFDSGAIVHDYYSRVVPANIDFGSHRDFKLVKDHRVQWDPGGSRQHRLEVKPHLKERGMLGALLAYMGLPRPAHGPGPLENPPDYKYARGADEGGHPVDQPARHGGFFSYLQLPTFPLSPSSSSGSSVIIGCNRCYLLKPS